MTALTTNACVAVAQGGVGESGASSQLIYQVNSKIAKLIVLKTSESSLCPNTGAVGILIVNGKPQAFGDLTPVGSSIQTEVHQGDNVVAIIHTVPLFNEIACIRLGELNVVLNECDLVRSRN